MTEEYGDPSVPQYYYALNSLGIHYDKLRWNDLAEQCYLKASVRVMIAKYNYASLLLILGKSKDVAIEFLNEYVSAFPDDCDGYRELAKAYGWKNTAKRQEMYEKAFEKGWSGDFYEILFHNINNLESSVAREKNNEIADQLYNRIVEYDGLDDADEKREKIKSLSPKICNQIGLIIFSGQYLIRQDYKKACQIWEITIKMKDFIDKKYLEDHINCATYNLALSYMKGEGVARDYTKAFALYMECQEDPDAQREIAEIYESGLLGVADKEKAREWYVKAANNKLPDYRSCLHLARSTEEFTVKERAQYFLKGIKRESIVKYNGVGKPKSYNISTDVMLYYEKKITKLKQKLLELECRPPEEGGRLFIEARTRFEANTKIM